MDLWAQYVARALQLAVELWRLSLVLSQEQHLMSVLVRALLRSWDHFRLVWWERRLRCVA